MAKKIVDPMQATSTKELIDYCLSIGYTEKKKNGSSHRIFSHANKPVLSIPDHKDLAPGTRRNIAKLIQGESYYQGKKGVLQYA
jgi:predicted RNA binding protein YcfA (HicA-like mRNA interferase family)